MTIPASYFVSATPGVLTAGGNALVMNGLFLTENVAMPTGTVLNFASLAAVGAFFGLSSAEYAAAIIYFAGSQNSTLKPGGMLFAAYNVAARSGFLQGGSLAGLSLTQLQAIAPGTLTITIAGTPETSSSINLSAATSFSNAATIITTAFTSPAFAVTWDAVASAFVVTSTATGVTETIAFATGAIAASLALTQATGAFLSQGAAIDTPASGIANAFANSQNWSTLVTLFEPNLADKSNFAIALNALDDEFLYDAWDSDPNAGVAGNQTCFGYVAQQAKYGCVSVVSADPALAAATGTTVAALALNAAVFIAGAIASVNFKQLNGRRSLAFQSSGSIQPTCANLQIAKNLIANGYNFYASTATANQGFVFLYNGQMAGSPFVSIVRFINQIYLNSQMQLTLLTLLTATGVGYEPEDFGLIRVSLVGSPGSGTFGTGPIADALAFGSIKTNVSLSAAQVSELNLAAGVNAASVVQTAGFYLQILDPGAPARQAGQSPIINLWYTDGGDVLQITLGSIDIL